MRITFVEQVMGGPLKNEDGTEFVGGQTPYRKDLPSGAAKWAVREDGSVTHLQFTCPCGCGAVSSLAVVVGYGDRWGWDGNKENPTLQPSIQKLTPCKWHGHLVIGEWKPA